MKHLITDIQRFSLNDGPGIRTTVFFKGCNMHCAWCHNPETLSFDEDILLYPAKCIGCGRCFSLCPQGAHTVENGVHRIDRALCQKCGKCAEHCYAEAIVRCGKEMSIADILREVERDRAYYAASGGGVTLSGGEVLCHLDFATELAKALRSAGISVAIESNLSLPYEQIRPLLSVIDLVMADIKLYDDGAHKAHTGLSNRQTLENIQKIEDIPLIVRTPLIAGITATEQNITAIARFLAGKKNLLYYQLLNFNPLGAAKYAGLNAENSCADLRPYDEKALAGFASLLAKVGIPFKVGD